MKILKIIFDSYKFNISSLALKKLAKNAIGKPVFANFENKIENVVGRITYARVFKDKIFARIKVKNEILKYVNYGIGFNTGTYNNVSIGTYVDRE